MRISSQQLIVFAALAVVLSAIAAVSPTPDRVTDRGVYEAIAEPRVVPDCGDIHCFRVLVPWMLGSLPGSSTLKWKAAAVVCDAAAAIAVWWFCTTVGLSAAAASMAMVASALGFGALYTLHDPYTADPLMFLLGPLIASLVVVERLALATTLAVVGVLAKEFAAAPLYVGSLHRALERRWEAALRALAGANTAFIAWALLTLTLMLRFNNSWGGSEASDVHGGAVLGPWLQRMSARGIAAAMFNEFGALWLLMPIGFLLAPRALRLMALASLPVVAVLVIVEQPDRALWNFHFVVTPLAATVLSAVPAALAWATVAAFGVANLRVAAQLPIPSIGRAAIALSVTLAAVAAWNAVRGAAARRVPDRPLPSPSGRVL